MCDLESKLTEIHSYKEFCQVKYYSKECCRPWSIPNYIALLSNKTTCHEIEVKCLWPRLCFGQLVHKTGIINDYFYSTKENDLFEMKQLLRECHRYFEDGSLKSDCENFKCFTPPKCMQFNAVYNILHFLADNKFNVSYSMRFFTHSTISLIKSSYSPGNKQLDNVDALLTNGKNYQNPVILLRYEASHTTKWYSQDSCHWYGAEECSLWWITISWQLAYRIRRDVHHVLHFNLYKLNFNNTINSGIKRSIGRCGLFHISSSVSTPIFSIYESLGHHHYSW